MGERWDNAEQAVKIGKEAVDDHVTIESLRWFDELDMFRRMVGKASLLVLHKNKGGSYKFRGAFSREYRLVEEAESKGKARPDIVAASAGNAGIGVKLAAKEFRLRGAIYVPKTIAGEKYDALQRAGDQNIEIIKAGEVFAETYEIAKQDGREFIEPYDHPDVMAGQGTVVDDALELAPDLTALVVPVGGGGLLGGITQRLRRLGREDVRIYGAEAEGKNGMSQSVRYSRLMSAAISNKYFGGLDVAQPGMHPYNAVKRARNVAYVPTSLEGVRNMAKNYLDLHDFRSEVLEPSSAVALEALRNLHISGQLQPTDHVLVLGTGHNENLANLFDDSTYRNDALGGNIGSH